MDVKLYLSPQGRTQTKGIWDQLMRRISGTKNKAVTGEWIHPVQEMGS
jgi:hypothetical protein